MPIYEYECSKCGHRFEVIQKFSDAPVKKCEKCKGKTDRLISSPAIQFKGSGWYADGYSKKSSASDSSESKDASASTDSPKSKDASSKESSGAESKSKSAPKKKVKKDAKGSSGSSK